MKLIWYSSELGIPDQDDVKLPIFVTLSLLVAIGLIGIVEWNLLGEQELLIENITYMAIIPIGFGFSYLLRRVPKYISMPVHFILGILMLISAWNFFRDLLTQLYDPRIPLIRLFIQLQVLHAFEIRKNHFYSLAGALIFASVSLVLASEGTVVLMMLPWIFTFILGISLYYLLCTAQSGDVVIRLLPFIKNGLKLSFILWLATVILFLLMPKPSGAYAFSFYLTPVSLTQSIFKSHFKANNVKWERMASHGDIPMPIRQNLRGKGLSLSERYYNLRDQVLLKVKARYVYYLRGVVYDTYDGRRWLRTLKGVRPLEQHNYKGFYITYRYNRPVNPVYDYQYFLIYADLPGTLIHTPDVFEVFYPADNIYLDMNDNLLIPSPLVHGMSYTVISAVYPLKPEDFNLDLEVYRAFVEQNYTYFYPYLYLGKVSVRVKELGKELVSQAGNLQEAIDYVKNYLSNYKYDTSVTYYSSDDIVDEFLFRKRRGYCIHFASAMALLLRAGGVPARFVTGYIVRHRDPFSGYWIVKSEDAHAWVEIFLPVRGGGVWVPVEATEGVLPVNFSRIHTLKYDLRKTFEWLPELLNTRLNIFGRQVKVIHIIFSSSKFVVILVLTLVLSFVILRWLMFLFLKLTIENELRRWDELSEEERASVFKRLISFLRLVGYRKEIWQTYSAFITEINNWHGLDRSVPNLIELINQAKDSYLFTRFGS